jgi:hypothetical protein
MIEIAIEGTGDDFAIKNAQRKQLVISKEVK